MIPLVKPYIAPQEEMMPAIQDILYSGYIATGQAVYDFEHLFQEYIGNPYAFSVHSGTDALHLSLLIAGVKPGDEVISTPMTSEPTNTAIVAMGAKIVWGDVDPDNGLLDPKSVRSLITPRTKAIMMVHYAGMVCDLNEFNKISADTGVPIIEDAAHALGAKYNGKMIGSNAPFTVFSLQAIKHLTTVDGGFLAVKNESDFDRGIRLRWFGLDKKHSRLANDIKEVGYKYAMNNVNATIGIVQMAHINDIVGKYIANGKFYDDALDGVSGVKIVRYNNNTEPSYWLYTMQVERRSDFMKMMEAAGIMATPLHHRSDTHTIFAESKRELPNMEKWYNSFVHIPCGWWVDEETRCKIVETIKKGW